MSCIYCKSYAGVNKYCLSAHMVITTHESIYCDDYEYNGEVKNDE